MGHLVHLPTGGLEQDRRTHPAVDVTEGALGVRIQGPGAGRLPRKVGVDGDIEPGLAQLAEHHGAELGRRATARSPG